MDANTPSCTQRGWGLLKGAVETGRVHDASCRASALKDLVHWHRHEDIRDAYQWKTGISCVCLCLCSRVFAIMCVCHVSRRLSVGNRPCVYVCMCLFKHVCSMSEMILDARDVTPPPPPPSIPLSCTHKQSAMMPERDSRHMQAALTHQATRSSISCERIEPDIRC